MDKNLKYEQIFGSITTDFFENYTACLLRVKEHTEIF